MQPDEAPKRMRRGPFLSLAWAEPVDLSAAVAKFAVDERIAPGLRALLKPRATR